MCGRVEVCYCARLHQILWNWVSDEVCYSCCYEARTWLIINHSNDARNKPNLQSLWSKVSLTLSLLLATIVDSSTPLQCRWRLKSTGRSVLLAMIVAVFTKVRGIACFQIFTPQKPGSERVKTRVAEYQSKMHGRKSARLFCVRWVWRVKGEVQQMRFWSLKWTILFSFSKNVTTSSISWLGLSVYNEIYVKIKIEFHSKIRFWFCGAQSELLDKGWKHWQSAEDQDWYKCLAAGSAPERHRSALRELPFSK